jgi:hypothetical protein
MGIAQPADRPEFLERHFMLWELAKAWGLNEATIRGWFIDEPGVLKIEHKLRKNKRGYVSLRVPESVARRVYLLRTGRNPQAA